MRLTAKNVLSLPLPDGRTEQFYWDDDLHGLALRVREGNRRTIVFQFRVGKQQRRISLGSVSALNFADTRREAEKLYARVKLGDDPAAAKVTAKLKASETFDAVARRFLEHQRTRLRAGSYREVERHLLLYAQPALRGMQLASIERRDVATVLAALTESSGAVTANRTRTTLSGMFAWAIMHGLTESNPVNGTLRNRERSRERVLDSAELRLIWTSLGDDQFAAIVRVLMLTGQREREIADLRWSELHDGTIILPSERTKNHRVHVVTLSTPARTIIETQPRRSNPDGRLRDLIFGFAAGGFTGWHVHKQRLDAKIAEATGKPLPHWTIHDLRRSVATGMVDIGVLPHVVEAVLNHISGHRGGVAGIYNRASYSNEKRAALDLWAEHLLAIVEGRESNVTALRREA
jgi:integrase